MNKKYALGLLVITVLAIVATAGFAHAATKGAPGLVFVESVDYIYKYYDRDANVICYAYIGRGGMSCLKNN